MKTKYDWSNVPKNVNWIATDSTGYKSHHEEKPKPISGDWFDCSARGCFDYFDSSEFKGYWKDSLEERPK